MMPWSDRSLRTERRHLTTTTSPDQTRPDQGVVRGLDDLETLQDRGNLFEEEDVTVVEGGLGLLEEGKG